MMGSSDDPTQNFDPATVRHFGQEWSTFRQDRGWTIDGLDKAFSQYFSPLPEGELNGNAVAGDFGAGSGRWASKIAPLVLRLYVLEPSSEAMAIAQQNLAQFGNVSFIEETIGSQSMPKGVLDVAYSIGVIHHIPDPVQALRDIRSSLKPHGVFLGYVYYALENRPRWYRTIWRMSDRVRLRVSRMPASCKRYFANFIATLIYWPLARTARMAEKLGVRVAQLPLSQYSDKSFYVMRNDALDRLGTPLEFRFTRVQITEMLRDAGFDISTLIFSETVPFWCFSVRNDAENL